ASGTTSGTASASTTESAAVAVADSAASTETSAATGSAPSSSATTTSFARAAKPIQIAARAVIDKMVTRLIARSALVSTVALHAQLIKLLHGRLGGIGVAGENRRFGVQQLA